MPTDDTRTDMTRAELERVLEAERALYRQRQALRERDRR